MLHFFSYLVLIENLTTEEEKNFSQFLVNSLQFIDISEVPTMVTDFNKKFETFYNPLMKLLYWKYEDLGDKDDMMFVK